MDKWVVKKPRLDGDQNKGSEKIENDISKAVMIFIKSHIFFKFSLLRFK